MRTPEQGPIDPNSDTAKAMREIEREWREKMGLPTMGLPATNENVKAETPDASPTDAEVADLLALREKWITKDASAH